MFLVDRVVAKRIGGPFFTFRPHFYGPFAEGVHHAVQKLVNDGDATLDESGPYPRHRLTGSGYRRGLDFLHALPDPVNDYIRRVAVWVLVVPYRQMLAAIHREYPEMAAKDARRDLKKLLPPRPKRHFLQGMASAFDLLALRDRTRGAADGFQADMAALSSDWQAVGEDIENAMMSVAKNEGIW